MAEEMFDGFDHTQYKDEVEQRWGKDAYAKSDALVALAERRQKKAWQARMARARRRLDRCGGPRRRPGERRGAGPRAAPVRLAEGHPGHARAAARPARRRSTSSGLGDMYVADDALREELRRRAEGATFVRDAMRVYADRNL